MMNSKFLSELYYISIKSIFDTYYLILCVGLVWKQDLSCRAFSSFDIFHRVIKNIDHLRSNINMKFQVLSDLCHHTLQQHDPILLHKKFLQSKDNTVRVVYE